MQKRWQNSVGKQAFAGAAGEICTEPFGISFASLGPIRRVSGLLDASPCSLKAKESWMGETFVRELELHLRGKRLGVRFINHIHVRYETQNTLLFFSFELLGSDFPR